MQLLSEDPDVVAMASTPVIDEGARDRAALEGAVTRPLASTARRREQSTPLWEIRRRWVQDWYGRELSDRA